jgi:hypothetical protein
MYRYIITYCNTVMTYIIFTKARLRLRVAVVVLGQPASEKCKPNQISHRPATSLRKRAMRGAQLERGLGGGKESQ